MTPKPPKDELSSGSVAFCVGIITCKSNSKEPIAESGLVD